MNNDEKRCSFCGNRVSESQLVIEGILDESRICDNCIRVCHEAYVMSQEKHEKDVAENNNQMEFERDPRKLVEKLNEFVIGQEKAKKVLSVAVCNHYKRLKMIDKGIEKTNILLIGPTGCGKTYLVQQIARTLSVPIAISEATSITEAGYVGRSVDSIFETLLRAANWDAEKAEKGIIYIDEIDKIASRNTSGMRDVSGEGVQQALLALLEKGDVEVKRKTEVGEETYVLDTSGILFICGGAFPGMIKEKKISKEIGFGKTSKIEKKIEIRESLKKFGMIPEFIGRLPAIVQLDELTADDLVRIMTETKNSIIEQYRALLAEDKIELEVDMLALRRIAEKAIERKIGARGLRSVVDELMLDPMYNAFSLKNTLVQLDEKAVAALG